MHDALTSLTRLGDWLLALLALVLVAFMFFYSIRFPWWRSAMGRHVAAFMGVGAFIVVIRVLRMAWPDSAVLIVARTVGLTVMLPVAVWRFVLMLRTPRRRPVPVATENGERS